MGRDKCRAPSAVPLNEDSHSVRPLFSSHNPQLSRPLISQAWFPEPCSESGLVPAFSVHQHRNTTTANSRCPPSHCPLRPGQRGYGFIQYRPPPRRRPRYCPA